MYFEPENCYSHVYLLPYKLFNILARKTVFRFSLISGISKSQKWKKMEFKIASLGESVISALTEMFHFYCAQAQNLKIRLSKWALDDRIRDI
jgi:hypothetical protein